MMNNLMKNVNCALNTAKHGVKKKSPEILIVAGIIGVVGAGIMACRATLKLPDIMDDMEEKLEEIHDKKEEIEDAGEDEVDIRRETAVVYGKTALKIVRLYAPSVGLGILSIGSIVTSNNILRKRNAAITAAYVALDQGFREYRGRVIERFGEEVDKQIKLNIHDEEIEETTVNDKGKEKTVKKNINVADPNAESEYVKYFTRSNPYWLNDPDQLRMFFKSRRNYLNDRLTIGEPVTLNEAYEALGFKRTKAGMVCGWMPKKNVNADGDGYVDFKIHEVCLPNEDGTYDMAYAIDFNVDGCIYDKFEGGVLI